ncbi:hypothetical protein [Rhizobium sp. HT1-10]|uniref:hypothetical protein n=1 Tax=Rhizobium sp. HT1-10 TaxID=3111638 RepID=UPI003C1E1075
MSDAPTKRPTAITKIDATNEAAYQLIDARDSAREAKTTRLRALRLAKEEADAKAAAEAPPKKKATRKKVAE